MVKSRPADKTIKAMFCIPSYYTSPLAPLLDSVEGKEKMCSPPLNVRGGWGCYNKNMHNQIQDQIKEAMKARDGVRLTTLRGVLASFTNEAMALKRKPQDKLTDEEAIVVIRRLVKQRKDSIEQFIKGNRQDLVDNESAELKILEEFLPAQMSEEKVREIVMKKKAEIGEVDKSKMGLFMGAVMKEINGQADGKLVKRIVEELL